MTIFPNSVDNLINRLEHAIPHVDTGISFGFAVERHGWRPVWALCREIQAAFRGFKGYASREEHQAAWQRFQTLRRRASELAEIEKEKFAAQSDRLRGEILAEAHASRYSLSADAILGAVLGHTTVEEMQGLQRRLKAAGRKLSENKALMTRADKEVCFEAIKEARESHDSFWERYKELKQERREARQRRHDEFVRKRAEWESRVRSNIARNRGKLDRASAALERTRDRIRDIEAKLRETDSAKWQGIFSDWLAEAEAKERDIEESVERIASWIREDEDRLSRA